MNIKLYYTYILELKVLIFNVQYIMSFTYSQYCQDIYFDKNIFKGYKNGVFMDIGAHDGITLNNTLYFEKNYNWTGVNVEPIKDVFDKLVINRPTSINLNVACSNKEGIAEFINTTGYTEMLSGLKDEYDSRHFNRVNQELHHYGGKLDIIRVNTKTVESICDMYSIKHINLMSIDVEGAEFSVIKSINFDKLFIDVICFENNYDDISAPIIKYLEDKNYKLIFKSNDIYMIHNRSKFNS
jgi:FkbM family methyltransferase